MVGKACTQVPSPPLDRERHSSQEFSLCGGPSPSWQGGNELRKPYLEDQVCTGLWTAAVLLGFGGTKNRQLWDFQGLLSLSVHFSTDGLLRSVLEKRQLPSPLTVS